MKNWGKKSRKWTREDLENAGIVDVNPDANRIKITRRTYNGAGWETKWEYAKTWPKNYPGQKSGYMFFDGIKHPTDGYKTINAHRLVWTWFNGEIPEGCVIDHIDHDPSNNSLSNLRLRTYEDNKGQDKIKVSEFIRLYAFVENHEIIGGAAWCKAYGYYSCGLKFFNDPKVSICVDYLKKQENGVYELDFDFKDSNMNWQRDGSSKEDYAYIVYMPFLPSKTAELPR